MEELVEEIEKENLGIKIGDQQIAIILYADDIILLSTEKDKIQRALKICENYGTVNEIKFNPEKTQQITFGNKKNRNKLIELEMYSKKLENTRKIKYLGVIINSENSIKDHIEERIKKTTNCFYGINNLGIEDPTLKSKIKSQLYKTLCRPILTYGIEALKVNDILKRKLKTTEGFLIKKMLGLGKKSRTKRLMSALDMETTQSLLLKRKLSFVGRLEKNEFTKNLVNNIILESRSLRKPLSKKSMILEIINILEIDTNIESLSKKAHERIKEENTAAKLEKKDGLVESIKYCISGNLSSEKQKKILELLTKPF